MKKPLFHDWEDKRMEELNSYSILDTIPEKDFNDITTIASQICKTPVSLITLIDNDRQWFKSKYGTTLKETPREYSFCGHAINVSSDIMVVNDARLDERFFDNPLVTHEPHVVFYAGVKLNTEKGLPIGTLCVIDQKPRKLSKKQIEGLKALGNQVIKLLELRKKESINKRINKRLQENNKILEEFSFYAAHDIKSPLKTIQNLIKIFTNRFGLRFSDEERRLMNSIESSAMKLTALVERLMDDIKNDHLDGLKKEKITLSQIEKELLDYFPSSNKYEINFNFSLKEIHFNRSALMQILINLISNAIRFNDKEIAEIDVGIKSENKNYDIYVMDNGPGLNGHQIDKIFDLFSVFHTIDRYGEFGTGIGMYIVKKLVEELDGEITVESEIKKGTIFYLSIPR